MGVLKEDMVNIIIHGHEPNLFESMLVSGNEPTFEIVLKAITRFKSRTMPVEIPKIVNQGIHGFSHE